MQRSWGQDSAADKLALAYLGGVCDRSVYALKEVTHCLLPQLRAAPVPH